MDVAGMQNARLGAIYLWQGTTMKSPLAKAVIGGALGSAGALAGLKDVNIPLPDQSTDVLATGWDVALDTEQGRVWATIKAWATEFVKEVWKKIKEVFGEIGELLGHLKSIALFVAQQVFTKAAPVIGSAAGLAQGLWKTTVAFCEKLGNWLAKRHVKLVHGHPKTLVNGIERGLTRALLEGLYETAKSSLLLGLNIASLGAASIIDAIAAVIEAVTKIIWRIAEAKIVRQFCAQAKVFWTGRSETNAIHLDSMKFDNWLKGATNKVPLIAAVTLGTGIAGDKMRFLQMYTGRGATISQSQFDSGVKYLDQMKRSGARLMERSDIEFDSDDGMIKGLLKLAESHDKVAAKPSFWKRLFRQTDKFMRV